KRRSRPAWPPTAAGRRGSCPGGTSRRWAGCPTGHAVATWPEFCQAAAGGATRLRPSAGACRSRSEPCLQARRARGLRALGTALLRGVLRRALRPSALPGALLPGALLPGALLPGALRRTVRLGTIRLSAGLRCGVTRVAETTRVTLRAPRAAPLRGLAFVHRVLAERWHDVGRMAGEADPGDAVSVELGDGEPVVLPAHRFAGLRQMPQLRDDEAGDRFV